MSGSFPPMMLKFSFRILPPNLPLNVCDKSVIFFLKGLFKLLKLNLTEVDGEYIPLLTKEMQMADFSQFQQEIDFFG